MKLCTTPTCGRKYYAKGMCNYHYQVAYRNGEIAPTPGMGRPRKDKVGYRTAQRRVTITRGPANAHQCERCDLPAERWSYRGTDTNEMTTIKGDQEVRYSCDPDHYGPVCLPCHLRQDRLARAEVGA